MGALFVFLADFKSGASGLRPGDGLHRPEPLGYHCQTLTGRRSEPSVLLRIT